MAAAAAMVNGMLTFTVWVLAALSIIRYLAGTIGFVRFASSDVPSAPVSGPVFQRS